MKIFLYFLLLITATIYCKSQNQKSRETTKPIINSFEYKHELSNFLSIPVLVNSSDTILLALDNGTYEKDVFIIDRNTAFLRKLISDTSGKSIRTFQDMPIILEFGSFSIISKNNQTIYKFPKSKKIKVEGLLGMGFLNDKILKINYTEHNFIIDTVLNIDTSKWQEFSLIKYGPLFKIPIAAFFNGKKICDFAALDLGYEGDGFFFAGKYTKRLASGVSKPNLISISSGNSTTGEQSTRYSCIIDSIQIGNQTRGLNISSIINIADNGIGGNDIVLFGNSVLKRFERIVVDFKHGKLFLPRI